MRAILPERQERHGSASGFVLILVSGFLTALILLASLFLTSSLHQSRTGRVAMDAVRSRVSAEAGMAYAAARLSRESTYPFRSSTISARGDDWTFRDPWEAGLSSALNPSWSHGEHWTDFGGGGRPGAYDPGADDISGSHWMDLDGDGKFSAWSGRLRGGDARTPDLFSLKVGATEGKIFVNAASGRVLDQLGLALGITTRLKSVACGWAPGGRIEWIPIGYDLKTLSPPGGYRTLDEVDAALGIAGYTQQDRDLILPNVSVDVPEMVELPRYGGGDPQKRVFVNLFVASRPVLEAVWLNLVLPISHDWDVAGYPSYRLSSEPSRAYHILTLDEARRLAQHVIDLRQAGLVTQESLFEAFCDNALDIFQEDFGALGGGFNARHQAMAQAEMAFRAVVLDRHTGSSPCASPAYSGWSQGRTAPEFLHACSIGSVLEGPGYDNGPPVFLGGYERMHLSTAPPARFEVFSIGKAAQGGTFQLDGRLCAHETVAFATQEDFEACVIDTARYGNMPARVPGRGVSIRDGGFSPAMRRDSRLNGDETYPQVDSVPGFHPRSTGWSVPSVDGGALTLATLIPAAASIGIPDLHGVFIEPFDFGSSPPRAWVPSDSYASAHWIPSPGNPPHFMFRSGISPASFGFTGLTPDFEHLQACSVEGWAVPGGASESGVMISADRTIRIDTGRNMTRAPYSRIYTYTGTENWIRVRTNKRLTVASGLEVHSTEYVVDVQWAQCPSTIMQGQSLQTVTRQASVRVPDWSDTPTRIVHVALTVDTVGADTEVRLYVNGSESLALTVPGLLPLTNMSNGSQTPWLSSGELTGSCDEPRLYGRALSAGEVADHFGQGRYVRTGTYTSPLYVLDQAGGVIRSQWTGIVPHGFPAQVLRVEAFGYGDPDGTVLAAGPFPLDQSGVVYDLPQEFQGVRSFRYKVYFDCSYAPSPLLDTPVFESIWFTVRQPGRAPRWSFWGAEPGPSRELSGSLPPDTDGDGIPDNQDPDADGDGVADNPDADGDGIPDDQDPDADGDGIPDGQVPDTDGDGIPDDQDPDADGSGIPDNQDTDGDGIPDDQDVDADGDGRPDGAGGQ